MASNCKEGPIPIGWTVELKVKKDGSETRVYSCPNTKQKFYTYSNLMRYVDCAQSRGLGIYKLSRKALKTTSSAKKKGKAHKNKKTTSLSVPKKRRSKPIPSTVGPGLDSKPLTSSGCTDKGKDHDQFPESKINGTPNQK